MWCVPGAARGASHARGKRPALTSLFTPRQVRLVEEELGLAEHTYFLYSSDHGFQLGNFNILMDKRHVYDWTTRIQCATAPSPSPARPPPF